MLALTFALSNAYAVPMAMDAQNRVHLGLNYTLSSNAVGLPAGGVTGGFESRMTRFLNMDVGGFFSPLALGEGLTAADPTESYLLRHGLYATLGVRPVHKQPEAFAWDVFLRLGGGVGWTADVSPDAIVVDQTNYLVSPTMAGVGGLDGSLRFGDYGLRLSGKGWLFDAVQANELLPTLLVRTQLSLEGMVQW